jgi:hypothetical protein
MKVVCIKEFKSQHHLSPSGLQHELTYGKIYECMNKPDWSSDDSYFIKCDLGFITSYHKRNFITLEEWRERQLNEIGI